MDVTEADLKDTTGTDFLTVVTAIDVSVSTAIRVFTTN
jgi:hypothetical protein